MLLKLFFHVEKSLDQKHSFEMAMLSNDAQKQMKAWSI